MLSSLEEHYSQLLGLSEDWSVSDVDLSTTDQQVVIHFEYTGDSSVCPTCDELSPVYDQRGDIRRWRHLDTMQFETCIESATPQVRCRNHGVKSIVMPWSEKSSRFTLLFEAFAIKVLQSARSVHEASVLLRLNWHQVEAIKARAVERGLSRRRQTKIAYLGIDEKSHRKGHDYVTLINDVSTGRVLEVVEERTRQACERALEKALSKRQRGWVEAVAMDMWPAYIDAVGSSLPDSHIVHDRYHISAHLNNAVDKVRRSEHKKLLEVGDSRLSNSRYFWLSREEQVSEKAAQRFGELKHAQLKTARAWALKESFGVFWDYRSQGWGSRHFTAWYSWAIRSRLDPIKQVARMIKTHLNQIFTWFTYRISNAVSEGLNSKIQTVKSNSRGFRSFESYRRSILFYCGKLDMAPNLLNRASQ